MGNSGAIVALVLLVLIVGFVGLVFTGYVDLDDFLPDDNGDDPYCGDGICSNGETTATCPSDCLPSNDVVGDMNCDGVLSDLDVVYLTNNIGGDPSCATLCADGDVDCSGSVNVGDVRYLSMHLDGATGYETLYPTC